MIHTAESRRKISEALKGRHHTAAAKDKMRAVRLAAGLKRFCPRGHDTLVPGGRIGAGRGRCRVCRSRWQDIGMVNADGTPFTFVDYDRTYQVQQGRCRGCLRHQAELKKALCADHDHVTGRVRGLLCVDCNYALGCVKDQPVVLQRLQEYLAHQETT